MPPEPPAFAPQRILEVLARHEVLCVVIASLQDVIRSKTAAGRAKDLAALPLLRVALARQQP